MTNAPRFVWAGLALTALLSLYGTLIRHKAEASNRAVGIAVESSVVRSIKPGRMSMTEAYAALKGAGVTSVTVSERTFSELVTTGEATFGSGDGDSVEVKVVRGMEAGLLQNLEWLGFRAEKRGLGSGLTVERRALSSLTCGLDPTEIGEAKSAGLSVVGRLSNPLGASLAYVEGSVRRLGTLGVNHYLPLGDQVLGDRELCARTAGLLAERGIRYLAAEFVKTSGEGKAAAAHPGNVMRLHSAQQAELMRMSEPAIVERYVKAAKERNIRMLLVRPSGSAGESFDSFKRLVGAIRGGLVAEGMAAKEPRPFEDPGVPQWLKGAIGIAMGPVLWWAVLCLWPGFRQKTALLAGCCLFGAAAFTGTGAEFVALAGSLAFPLVGLSWLLSGDRPGWKQYLGLSGITLVGGLPCAVMLTGLRYMLQVDQFTGVKLAVFGPILVGAWLIAGRVRPMREVLASPVMWGTLFASLGGLFALAFMASRTGNDNPAAVSGTELAMRDMLDRFLPVRPRTKEFMIGHPALVMGLGLAGFAGKGGGKSVWWGLALGLGMVGQTSVVNTLCHAHTPVFLSLSRILSGHIAGCILGLLGWVLLRAILARRSLG